MCILCCLQWIPSSLSAAIKETPSKAFLWSLLVGETYWYFLIIVLTCHYWFSFSLGCLRCHVSLKKKKKRIVVSIRCIQGLPAFYHSVGPLKSVLFAITTWPSPKDTQSVFTIWVKGVKQIITRSVINSLSCHKVLSILTNILFVGDATVSCRHHFQTDNSLFPCYLQVSV